MKSSDVLTHLAQCVFERVCEGVAECVIFVWFLTSTWGHAGGASKTANIWGTSYTVVRERNSFSALKRKRLTQSFEKRVLSRTSIYQTRHSHSLKLTRQFLLIHISSSHLSYQKFEAGFEQECMICSRLREEYRCASPQSGTASAATCQLQLMYEADFCLRSADTILTTHRCRQILLMHAVEYVYIQ